MMLSPYYLVAVNLVLLALAAYSASAVVSTAIASRLIPPPQVELSPPPDALAPAPPKKLDHYASIYRPGIFGPPEEAKAAAPPPTEAPPPNLKLNGVSVHDDGSSFCIIEDQKSHKQSLYRIGTTVEGTDAKVKEVTWDRCVLDRGGKMLVLEFALTPAMIPVTLPTPGRAAAAGSRAPTDEHVRAVSDTEYEIDRSEVDSALENMSQLFTQIRAVPHFDSGKSVGFRVFAIRQGSLFDKIGLKNGDVLQKINGQELSDPGRALALLQDLRNETALSVELLRNRQQQTLSYQIR